MSEFTDTNTLGELQKLMRTPEGDLTHLKSQLNLLAQVLFFEGDKEEGLERAALGGLYFCMQRMRELWNTPETRTKTLEELAEVYAKVELQRFTKSQADVKEQAQIFAEDHIRCNAHRFEVNGEEFFLLSSATNQTTREGKRLFQGEILETADPGVPNFQRIVEHLQKQGRKE